MPFHSGAVMFTGLSPGIVKIFNLSATVEHGRSPYQILIGLLVWLVVRLLVWLCGQVRLAQRRTCATYIARLMDIHCLDFKSMRLLLSTRFSNPCATDSYYSCSGALWGAIQREKYVFLFFTYVLFRTFRTWAAVGLSVALFPETIPTTISPLKRHTGQIRGTGGAMRGYAS